MIEVVVVAARFSDQLVVEEQVVGLVVQSVAEELLAQDRLADSADFDFVGVPEAAGVLVEALEDSLC